MKKPWKTYVFFIVLAELVGMAAGLLTRSGVEAFEAVPKSELTPPDVVFPIVWTALYALMGIGMARVWNNSVSAERSRGIVFFLVQLAFNFVWSLLFFNAQNYGLSLAWIVVLWVLILLMTISFFKTDRIAGLLQIPYLLWTAFAAYLTYAVWMLNP